MMYWFNTLKKHITKEFGDNPKIKVLEIGVYHGANTSKLLENLTNIQLTSIDPSKYHYINDLETQYQDRFTFIPEFSLNILPNLEEFDVVLIDGDHNRYTVYNELKTIFNTYKQFPLIILHDIGKPWGREDFSYNPDTIPEGEYGKEPQGVLTGVEQFIEDFTVESDTPVWFKLVLYPYGPGLGVLEQMEGNI